MFTIPSALFTILYSFILENPFSPFISTFKLCVPTLKESEEILQGNGIVFGEAIFLPSK